MGYKKMLAVISTAMVTAASLLSALPASAETNGDYEYREMTYNRAEIIKYTGDSKSVTIPTKINGLLVASVADGAFSDTKVDQVLLNHDIIRYPQKDDVEYLITGEAITYPIQTEGDFQYKYTFGNTAQIVKYTGTKPLSQIPESIGGYEVTSIGSKEFENRDDIEMLFIPNCVTSFSSDAFEGCDNLTLSGHAYSYAASMAGKYKLNGLFLEDSYIINTCPRPEISAYEDSVILDLKYNKAFYFKGFSIAIADNDSFKDAKTITTNRSHIVFDGLKKNTKYYISVKPYEEYNGTVYYGKADVYTASTSNVKLLPPSVDSTYTASRAVRFEFNDTSADGYVVRIADNKEFNKNTAKFSTSKSVRFDNLLPGTEYYVRACTFKKVDGKNIYSDSITFNVTTDKIAAPTLTFANTTQNAMRIQIKNTGADVYKVWVSADKNFAAGKTRYTRLESKNETRYDNLANKNSSYYVKTQACKNINGKWYYSDPVITKIKLSPKLSNADIDGIYTASTAARIELKKNASAGGYKIWICGDKDFSPNKTRLYRTSSNDKTSIRFDNLALRNHTYFVKVQSYKFYNNGVTTQPVYSPTAVYTAITTK